MKPVNHRDIQTAPHGDMPLDEVMQQLGVLLKGNAVSKHEIHMDNAMGKGVMWGEELAPGIEIISWQAQLHKPVQIVRTPGSAAPVWAIMLTDSPRIQASEENNAQSSSAKSNVGSMAYLYNHHLAINMLFESTGPVRMLLMRLKPDAWQHILVNQSPSVKAFIESEEPQFYGLGLNEKLLDDFSQLIALKPSPDRPAWTSLAFAINIFSEVFSLFDKRTQQQPQTGMRSQDASRLYRAHSLLLQDFQTPIAIEAICKEVGLGRDKFRKLFQQVYGTTPFQYFQQQRMEEARRLIASGEHGVMDVGHLVGYSHMGHFSQAFKKEFGFLPKEARPKGPRLTDGPT